MRKDFAALHLSSSSALSACENKRTCCTFSGYYYEIPSKGAIRINTQVITRVDFALLWRNDWSACIRLKMKACWRAVLCRSTWTFWAGPWLRITKRPSRFSGPMSTWMRWYAGCCGWFKVLVAHKIETSVRKEWHLQRSAQICFLSDGEFQISLVHLCEAFAVYHPGKLSFNSVPALFVKTD